MNHQYRLVWSDEQLRYVAVPECARGRGKGKSKGSKVGMARAGSVMLLAALSFAAHALPTGGAVSSGSGSITQSGSTLTVNQATPKLAVNWNSFNVGANETVNFVQPGRSSVALNRVLGSDPSAVYGRLNANGQVFLLNPNGVLFGKTAQVSVGGLVASTLGLSDAKFNAGTYNFSGSGTNATNGTASVVNQGSIIAAEGGYVALLGAQVSNQGTISAKLGNVSLAAGSDVTLDLAGDGLIGLTVNQGVVDALAENSQLINADGGSVLLTARAADALVQAVVNNSGVIEARTLGEHAGRIVLLSDMANGVTHVDGTLDASAPSTGNGGFIETSAAHVTVADNAKITTLAANGKTGTWLIDPNDYTVASSGGDITGALLSSQLGSNNVTILSGQGATAGNGDVFVNDKVSWSADTTLTLSAYRNVDIKANITATGNNAGLVLSPDNTSTGIGSYSLKNGAAITLSGSNPSLSIAGQAYTVVNDVTALQALDGANNYGAHYALGSDIDASATASWNLTLGFKPIQIYSATFDGLGHAISNLTIDRPSTSEVGLFDAPSGVIRNIGLVDADIHGLDMVGGLAGRLYGSVTNSYVTGTVTGAGSDVGGLIGYADSASSISASHADATVTGVSLTGGLVGRAYGAVNDSYAAGSVVGSGNWTGGLVGAAYGATVSKSYATNSVTGAGDAGGLVGQTIGGQIDQSYSSGAVTGSGSGVGGLVGQNNGSATSVSSSYWDTESSGQSVGVGVGSTTGTTGLTTAQAMNPANYTGWDFANNWYQVSGNTRPFLRSEYSVNIRNLHELQLMALDLAGNYTQTATFSVGETSGSNAADMWTTQGFVPVGSAAGVFYGSFDGQGYIIVDLKINRPGAANQGLFGKTLFATISNVHLDYVSVTGANQVGALVGLSQYDTLSNNYAYGSVTGASNVGGLVGYSNQGTMQGSQFAGSVTGMNNYVGGLIGYATVLAADNIPQLVTNSQSSATVDGGGTDTGGLIGWAGNGATITGSHATGQVTGVTNVGGLVGSLDNGSFVNGGSYATGNVSGSTSVGGLVGLNSMSIIGGGQASGIVTGMSEVGGLVGRNMDGFILTSAATGVVAATGANVGGLVGLSEAVSDVSTIDNSHATGTVSSNGDKVGGLVGGTTIGNSITASSSSSDVGSLGSSVGGLVGSNLGTISGSYAIGAVSGLGSGVGGLAGITTGDISLSYATGQVNSLSSGGANSVGGLVGTNIGAVISDSYATGKVYGADDVGGLVGHIASGATVTSTFASGNVISSGTKAGGLVGESTGSSSISNSFATGMVSGNTAQGGLVGSIDTGSIADSYATGSVIGTTAVGGLVGSAVNSTIDRSYAENNVSGTTAVGGLVGAALLGDTFASSYWYDNNGLLGVGSGSSAGVTGLSLAQMTQAASFVGFDIASTGGSTSVWRIYEGQTEPLLRSFLTPLSVTVADASKTYDATAQGAYGVTLGSTVMPSIWHAASTPDSTLVKGSANSSAVNVGTYALDGSGLYSGQLGYDLTTSGTGTLTINPAVLTVTGVVANNKTYDSTTTATLAAAALSGLVGGQTLVLVQPTSADFADKNAGTGKIVTVGGYTLADGTGLASNYVLASSSATTTADITPAVLTVSGIAANNKVYDGSTAATLTNSGTLSGLVNGETLVLGAGTASFADKNAGTGKTVTVDYTLTDGTGSANNYTLAFGAATTTADITPKALTVGTIVANNKVYDGTTAATLSLASTLNGLVGSETLGLTATSADFADKNAGTGKTVTVAGYTLADGAGLASNYTLASNSAVTTADIMPATLTVAGITASNKIYDGSTAATIDAAAAALSGMVAGDTVSLNSGALSGTFADKNAGTAKVVTVAGFTLSGSDAGNYQLGTSSAATTADITPKTLTVGNVVVNNKPYDGNTAATLSLASTLNGLVGSETLALTATSATFADKNAGTGKTVTVAGYTLGDGTGTASNYTLASNAVSTTANITPVELTVTAGNASRLVGEANPAFSATSSGLVGWDTLNSVVTGSLGFATSATTSSPAGFYAITPSGYVLLGSNYTLAYVNGQLTVAAIPGTDTTGTTTGFDSAVSDAQAYLAGTIESKGGIQVVYLNADGKAVPEALAALTGRAALGANAQREKVAGARGDLLLTVRDGGVRLPIGLASN